MDAELKRLCACQLLSTYQTGRITGDNRQRGYPACRQNPSACHEVIYIFPPDQAQGTWRTVRGVWIRG
jgi:hypothetical protein